MLKYLYSLITLSFLKIINFLVRQLVFLFHFLWSVARLTVFLCHVTLFVHASWTPVLVFVHLVGLLGMCPRVLAE